MIIQQLYSFLNTAVSLLLLVSLSLDFFTKSLSSQLLIAKLFCSILSPTGTSKQGPATTMADEKESTSVPLSSSGQRDIDEVGEGGGDPEDPVKARPPTAPNSSTRQVRPIRTPHLAVADFFFGGFFLWLSLSYDRRFRRDRSGLGVDPVLIGFLYLGSWFCALLVDFWQFGCFMGVLESPVVWNHS